MNEIQSLARGLRILDLIAESNHGLTLSEIAQELDIDKSSASRLVKTLVNYGYVQPDARRYDFGKRFYTISWRLQNRMPIRLKAKPYLHRLVNETKEAAHTAVYSEGQALVTDDVEAASGTLRVVTGTGRLIPLHCTAVGKGLLAFSDIPFPDDLYPCTSKTRTNRDALIMHLNDVRERGYALDDEEHEEGIRCIAAPVYNGMGVVIATIGISGPTVRITTERVSSLAACVMTAAAELSSELGYKQEVAHTEKIEHDQKL
ncbi:MAG: IclR family transcriptional regulator [Anaerolineae bacterium]